MHATRLLLGFGFTNLAMLGWLAAAAAPLVIHLWSRRRYREVPWAAVAFLLAAMRKNSRRIQLQQWLLLAVRTLLILLVVLAVAKPYANEAGVGGSLVPTHRVVVIDTSFSMTYRDADSTRLARAKELAASVVARQGPADKLTVLTLADPPRELAGLEAVTATQGRADLAATLDLIAAALKPEADSPARFDRQQVTTFSDLQRSTWESASTEQFDKLAEQASFSAVDVGTPNTANLAVTDLRAAAAFVTVGVEIPFDATLHEFGNEPRKDCAVEFLVDEIPIRRQTIDVPAGGDATLRFSHRFRTPGSHIVAVRASGDMLDLDNTRWLAVPVDERVNVLCVGGQRADVKYIVDALNPDGSSESPIRPQIATEGELAEIDLAPFDCVFLSNIAQLTSDEVDRFKRYVAQGGGLAIFLGDEVQADSYNFAFAREESLLPVRLGEIATESRFGIDPQDYRHPIVAPFRGRERAGLLTTPVRKYFRLEQVKVGAIEVAATLANGDPLIVTSSFGRGRVVLVATAGSLASVDAAGEPWTAWPAWPSFLPIVREMLNYAVGGRQGTWQTTVGASLPLPAGRGPWEITRPDGRTTSVSSDTDISGIYTMRRAGSEDVTRYAVNIDTRESDLAQADASKLPPQLNLGTTIDVLTDNRTAASAAWQSPLLWTALALLLAEMCLAWLFGRGVA
ncbi:MAG: BatA domain-containing protein [Pirellulales bacterium]